MEKRKMTAGFTLVELIVVIAILGILAGVGTVGYSGYIKKANMAADQQLVSDIENALTLAGYGGTFAEGDSGSIILSTSGITNANDIVDGSPLDEAMKAAFGAGYKTSVKLTYDGWEMDLNTNVTKDEALIVSGSSYIAGGRADILLSDVETLTSMAGNLVTALNNSGGFMEEVTLSTLFGEDVLTETGTKYGITLAEGETWDTWGAKEENKTAYGNLLVLAAANENQKTIDNFEYQVSPAVEIINEFSQYYAFASTSPEFSAVLTEYLRKMDAEVTDASSGSAWYNSLETEVNKYTNADGKTFAQYIATNELGDSDAFDDQLAFMAILGNLAKSDPDKIAVDLNNPNLFTRGTVKDMYDNYMKTVDILTTSGVDTTAVGTGQVGIFFANNGLETKIQSTLQAE